jgi:hypothetical protein
MNPYFLIAILLAFMGAGWGGFKLGVDHQKAGEIDKKELVAEAVDAANNVSAAAIAELRPKYTTINQEVRHEVQTNTIFSECKLPANSVRLVNTALDPSAAYSLGDSKLPKVDATK